MLLINAANTFYICQFVKKQVKIKFIIVMQLKSIQQTVFTNQVFPAIFLSIMNLKSVCQNTITVRSLGETVFQNVKKILINLKLLNDIASVNV